MLGAKDYSVTNICAKLIGSQCFGNHIYQVKQAFFKAQNFQSQVGSNASLLKNQTSSVRLKTKGLHTLSKSGKCKTRTSKTHLVKKNKSHLFMSSIIICFCYSSKSNSDQNPTIEQATDNVQLGFRCRAKIGFPDGHNQTQLEVNGRFHWHQTFCRPPACPSKKEIRTLYPNIQSLFHSNVAD